MLIYIVAMVVMLLVIAGVLLGGTLAMRESPCRNHSECPLTTTPPSAG